MILKITQEFLEKKLLNSKKMKDELKEMQGENAILNRTYQIIKNK